MKALLQLACSARIARSALPIAFLVGTVLNLVNQGEIILAGDAVDWLRLLLNYLVPYCVASYSAAKNELMRIRENDE